MCTWLSIRPGINVRPPPLIRVNFVPAGGATAWLEIDWIRLPTTSTLDGAERRAEVPSNTRTFSNSTAVWAD